MKYLIVQDWSNTHGNHAGMVHMCNLLKQSYPGEYTVIESPYPRDIFPSTNILFKKINSVLKKKYYERMYLNLCRKEFLSLQDDDEVFLLESMVEFVSQLGVAKYIKNVFPRVSVYALCHLTPTYFSNKDIYPALIKRWEPYVDKMLTLGSSLSQYLLENGVPKNKISTGFHYVDNRYYENKFLQKPDGKLKAIVMGGMQRNYILLKEIVRKTPMIDWTICAGRSKMKLIFEGISNVCIKEYLEEFELRTIMSENDISVNIMDDTVGSNVITTSMAMGMAMVVSDVGSIRNYCDEENAIFCQNEANSFVQALNSLIDDEMRVFQMKLHSISLSSSFSIANVHKWFSSEGK